MPESITQKECYEINCLLLGCDPLYQLLQKRLGRDRLGCSQENDRSDELRSSGCSSKLFIQSRK
jgi:hypothetical protein